MSKILLNNNVSYNELNIIFVSSFHDVPLNGTCTYRGEFCEFKIFINDYWDDDNGTLLYAVYKLTILEKFRWKRRQFLFEQCVGYHNTYNINKKNCGFYYRNPIWLYKLLFKMYYKSKKN